MLWGMIPLLHLEKGFILKGYSSDIAQRSNKRSSNDDLWRGGRAAEGTGLLNRHRSKACRGFKSRPLRHTEPGELIFFQ